MTSWKIKLQSKKEVAKDTVSFYFEKPKDYNFIAGQYAGWTLINPPTTDAKGNSRTFTISSAPFEPHLSFTTRIRSTSFKKNCLGMPIGAEIEISQAEGDFVLPTIKQWSNETIVFLAGGIGITPFRSMSLQAAHDHLPYKMFLFYSNRTQADAVFLQELQNLEKQNPNFQLLATMTQDENWAGEKSRINEAFLLKYLKNLKSLKYFVAGPPAMVNSLREMLVNEVKIPTESILSDSFSGY